MPQSANRPTGRLMKNTQRQSKFSVSQPPSIGPRIGPTMMPAPQIAIACPTFCGGLMSSSTACDSGTRAAPNTPCSSRAATIPPSEVAMPHSAEATVKPTIETMKTLRRPQREHSQPVSGKAMAEATM